MPGRAPHLQAKAGKAVDSRVLQKDPPWFNRPLVSKALPEVLKVSRKSGFRKPAAVDALPGWRNVPDLACMPS